MKREVLRWYVLKFFIVACCRSKNVEKPPTLYRHSIAFFENEFPAIKFLNDIYIIQGELLHYILQRKHHVRIDGPQ